MENSPKVRIVGNGSQLRSLQKKAGNLSIEFLGGMNREDLRIQMQTCSFLVLPSRFETYGNVLLEAMACGKPVIATKCGGPEEIVSKATGLLCDPTAVSIGDAIRQLMMDSKNYDAKQIREEVTNRFSVEKWTGEVEKVFKAVVSR